MGNAAIRQGCDDDRSQAGIPPQAAVPQRSQGIAGVVSRMF